MQNVAVGQETAVIGWEAPTGGEGCDHGPGAAAVVVVVVVVVDFVVVVVGADDDAGPPHPAARTMTTQRAGTDDRRRRLVAVRSTGHCPMGRCPVGGGRRLRVTIP
jgi:hypothetical protein